MASLFKDIKSKQFQKKVNDFITSFENLSEKEALEKYLNHTEFKDNENVLSYLFFHYPKIINILPLDFQISRINSNLSMFREGSKEARYAVVSQWLKNNKFFINSSSVNFDEDELKEYLKLYFNQPDDVSKLYMNDLETVIRILSESDLNQTEKIIDSIKDKLTDRQWEYIVGVNPIFIKYSSQSIQEKYSSDEKYIMYLNGDAKDKLVNKQLDKIKNDLSLFKTSNSDIKREFLLKYPFMINYIDQDDVISLLKSDISFIKYLYMPLFKSKEDKGHEIIYAVLDNIQNKPINDIVNIFIDKCFLNARGKIYRFDKKSNNLSYQYTKRLINIFQTLNINQISSLINIDSNYAVIYCLPLYPENLNKEDKEHIIIESNSRCLNLFKEYFGNEIYEEYYKVINKIYSEYINNSNKYYYENDYNSIFDLLKILFNKNIIKNNTKEKIGLFIGMSILNKDSSNTNMISESNTLLNELLSNAYGYRVDNTDNIYDIYYLEKFDSRLSFISKELLNDFCKYNFVNMSTLLYIVKNNNTLGLFKYYYDIVTSIYPPSKEILYRCIESFTYYREILSELYKKETIEDEESIINLFSTFGNPLNIKSVNELSTYNISLLKKFVNDLGAFKDINLYKNLISNYLFNIPYDDYGSCGWLEIDNIKELCEIYNSEALENFTVNGEKIFTDEDVILFNLLTLLFDITDYNLLVNYVDSILTNKIDRNVVAVSDLFIKLKKYRCEIINSQIVSLNDIYELYNSSPNMLKKYDKFGVEVFEIKNQDFKVLCSSYDDGYHYKCLNVSELKNNSYGYNSLIKSGSVRFSIVGDELLIKFNKDRIKPNSMRVNFILCVGVITDELLEVAKKYKLSIVCV